MIYITITSITFVSIKLQLEGNITILVAARRKINSMEENTVNINFIDS